MTGTVGVSRKNETTKKIYEARTNWFALRFLREIGSLRFSSAFPKSGAADDGLVKADASKWWPWWPALFLLLLGAVLVTVIISVMW